MWIISTCESLTAFGGDKRKTKWELNFKPPIPTLVRVSYECISRAWSTIQYVPGTQLDRFANDLEQLAEGLGYNAESVKNKLVECLPHHARMFIRHEYGVAEIIKEAERVSC